MTGNAGKVGFQESDCGHIQLGCLLDSKWRCHVDNGYESVKTKGVSVMFCCIMKYPKT